MSHGELKVNSMAKAKTDAVNCPVHEEQVQSSYSVPRPQSPSPSPGAVTTPIRKVNTQANQVIRVRISHGVSLLYCHWFHIRDHGEES